MPCYLLPSLGHHRSAAVKGLDKFRRDLRDDRIAVGAQASHSGGSPMSQRECAGFNWPPLSIPAVEPVSISPVAVSRAGPVIAAVVCKFSPPSLPCVPAPVPLLLVGVGQPARFACLGNWSNRCAPSALGAMSAPLSFQSRVAGVVQPASCAVSASAIAPARGATLPPLSASVCSGVGHPVQSLSDMRRTDARSADIGRPEGVVRTFQVSVYKVEPSEPVLACNLLAKDNSRSSLADEVEERGPKVPLISKPAAFACDGERLAGAASSPHRPVIGPTCESEGVAPDADAGEEVALGIALEVVGSDIVDAPFIHVTGRDVLGGDQVPQPLRGVRINFVVVGCHFTTRRNASA